MQLISAHSNDQRIVAGLKNKKSKNIFLKDIKLREMGCWHYSIFRLLLDIEILNQDLGAAYAKTNFFALGLAEDIIAVEYRTIQFVDI